MVATRKDTATKRVAQPLLDAKRKRRTKAEIEADKQRLEQEHQKAEQERHAGNERIASIQDMQALQDVRARVAAKPRPRLAQPVSNGHPSVIADETANDCMEVDVSAARTATVEGLRPKKDPRKTAHRNAVDALRQEVLAGPGSSSTRGSEERNNLSDGRENSKDAFLGYMKEWVTDLAKDNKSNKPPSQQIANSSKVASRACISSFTSATATSKTTACSSAPKIPPSHSPSPSGANSDDEPPAVLLDDDDAVEREAAHAFANSQRDQSSVLSKEKSIDYDHPPFTQKPMVTPVPVEAELDDDSMAVTIDGSDTNDSTITSSQVAVARSGSTLAGRKRTTTIPAAEHGEAPALKRSRSTAVQGETRIEGSTRKVKFNNSHLPHGAMTDNKWRGTLIPTYAKWNGMLNTCWGTKSSSEVEVLQYLWDIIYKRKIPAIVQVDDPIHTVATQRIAEWRGGFASASISMLYSLLNSNENFRSREAQRELAEFWLEGNRFLFEDVKGETVQEYTGMWKSPFVLQTFAAHMHFIQGAMDIPMDTGLKDNKYAYPKAALALAGTAVKCVFVLLRDDALTFEIIPPTGKGKSRATGNEKWKANISGEMFKKDFWGYETIRYMKSVDGIPPKVWEEIFEATLRFVKETMRKPGRGSSSDDECTEVLGDDDADEYCDLMTYR